MRPRSSTLAATLAGMVVNPVLPSLRDHELQFILSDADSRAIFVPADFAKHDYVAMLDRVTAAMASAARGSGVARRRGTHTPYPSLFDRTGARACRR